MAFFICIMGFMLELPRAAAGSSQALYLQRWMRLMIAQFICKCWPAGGRINLAEYQQEIILLNFSGFGRKVKIWERQRESERGIHLSLMDLSRFLQGSCSKSGVICWAESHCEKWRRGWKMLSGNIWLRTNNYMSLSTFSLFLRLLFLLLLPLLPAERDGAGAGRPCVEVCEGPER